MMTKTDVFVRATLEEIKRSRWYNGEVYSQQELLNSLPNLLKNVKLF